MKFQNSYVRHWPTTANRNRPEAWRTTWSIISIWARRDIFVSAQRRSWLAGHAVIYLTTISHMPDSSKSIIFVSSVQKELAAERRALKEYVHNDPLLRQFFEVFLFEDLPASGRRADEVYLGEVDRCDVYVGIFGDSYGFEDGGGVSPTEREFDRATAAGKERLVFVKGTSDTARHPKMLALTRRASDQVVRRRFSTLPELTGGLYGSLVERLARAGEIRSLPFDAAACPRTTLDDLSPKKVAEFLRLAQSRRGYALGPETPMRDALIHLNLLDGDRPAMPRSFFSPTIPSGFS